MSTSGRDYNELGRKLLDEGNLEAAIEAFESAIAASPKVAIPWFSLGLLYKRQRKWQKSLECNQNAVRLDRNSDDAWWNLGIAATALGSGDWRGRRGINLERS